MVYFQLMIYNMKNLVGKFIHSLKLLLLMVLLIVITLPRGLWEGLVQLLKPSLLRSIKAVSQDTSKVYRLQWAIEQMVHPSPLSLRVRVMNIMSLTWALRETSTGEEF